MVFNFQQELHEKNENTVAARLSQNILFEKFPQVDCKVLVEMLKAHNYSLHDTIGSLTLALDQPAQPGSSSQPLPVGIREHSLVFTHIYFKWVNFNTS